MNRHFRRASGPVAALLIFCLTAGAQVATVDKVDLEMMAKIRAEGLERSEIMDTLSYLTDVIGPRLTGSPGMKAANEWTKNKLAGYGLVNAQVEPWGEFGRGWSFDRVLANVTEPVAFPVFAYPKAWTPGTDGIISAEVIHFDVKSEADFDKYRGKLKGKIVLASPMVEVNAWFKAPGTRNTDEELLAMANAEPPAAQQGGRPGGDPGNSRQAQMALAQRRSEFLRTEGAAVVVDIGRRGDGGTLFVQSGGGREKGAVPPPPSITIAVEHYGRILRTLQKGIKVKMDVGVQARFYDEDLTAYNTVAEIPGTDKRDELVMLGGHLDSWHTGTGATDNAAGCAVALEAVRILKKLGVQPRRTIRVALWSGEEQGLLGSRAYVNQHFASRPAAPPGQQRGFGGPQGPLTLRPEHDKLSVYFNLDNGTGKIRGVYLQGNEAVRSIFRAWLAPFKDLGASTLTISNTSGTDHQSFDGVGLPAFQFIQDEIEYETRTHHSNMDVYERIQAEDMKQAAVIMAAFVYNAAMREQKLPRKPLPAAAQAATARP
ncbi:MAG: M20/M25/M40 family metallo-hydrolase [Acidobacteriota bacterium]